MATYLDKIATILKLPIGSVKISVQTCTYLVTAPQPDVGGKAQPHLQIGRFHLVQLPGCCGVVVSFGSSVYPPNQKKGIGNLLMQMREQIAWDCGYTLMLATDVRRDGPQYKLFKKNGWVAVKDFQNRRTNNTVDLQTKALKDSGIAVGQTGVGIGTTL